MNEELWKTCPIEEFKDFYEVSSMGRIKSVDRIVQYSNGRKRFFTPIALCDLNGQPFGVYNNLHICVKHNPQFNFGTMQKRSQDSGVYMKKYIIIKISKYDFLTADKKIINKTLE